MKYSSLFIIAFIAIISSCSPSYYPQKFNAPLLREQGETKINAAGNINSLNLQGSTAITDKFALAASFNGFFVGGPSITTNSGTISDDGSQGFQIDVMPGYYVPFGEIGVMEIYGGYGTGYTNSGEVNGILHRLIFQPSIGIASNRFEFAFACRFTRVMIPSTAMLDDNPRPFSETFLEPGLVFRLGSERIKFTSQLGLSLPIVNIPDDPNGNFIEWNPLILNIGIQINLNSDWY
tara:strand:- start:538 stop:1242 length:705 start_codon:yes stop_codon:yes gene_type:complete